MHSYAPGNLEIRCECMTLIKIKMTSTSIPRVDGLLTDPPISGCHNRDKISLVH